MNSSFYKFGLFVFLISSLVLTTLPGCKQEKPRAEKQKNSSKNEMIEEPNYDYRKLVVVPMIALSDKMSMGNLKRQDAQLAYQQKEYRLVVDLLSQLNDIDKNDPEVMLAHAISLYQLKKREEAAALFEKLKARVPKYKGTSCYYLGVIYGELRDQNKSMSYFNQIPESESYWKKHASRISQEVLSAN